MSARSEARASLMLVIVTAMWGFSFLWVKEWQLAARDAPVGDALSALTLIGLRMPLALLVLGLWQPQVVLGPTRKEYLGGVVLGAVCFSGFALQTWGLSYTTPALSAFFTCLCCAWAPMIAVLFLREKISLLTLLGLALALVGCAVLVEGWKLGKGEWLTLVASGLFAGQILLLDRLGKRLEPAHLTAGFFGAAGALALSCGALAALSGCGVSVWLEWVGSMLTRPMVLVGLGYMIVFSTVLSFHWMNRFQPLVSPTRAALLYLLEPVFTAVFSIPAGHDELTTSLVAGGLLILAGNALGVLPKRSDKPEADSCRTN